MCRRHTRTEGVAQLVEPDLSYTRTREVLLEALEDGASGEWLAGERVAEDEVVVSLKSGVPDTRLGPLDRVLYLTAAMTGLRQGELLGLRWRDIDWGASRVRIRQRYVRGEFGRPKSKRSSRSV